MSEGFLLSLAISVVVKNVATADSFSFKCWKAFINAVGEAEETGFWMHWAWSAQDSLFNIHKLMLLLEPAMFSVAIFDFLLVINCVFFLVTVETLYMQKLLHIHEKKQYTPAVEMWFIFGLGIRAQWFDVLSLVLLIWHLMPLHQYNLLVFFNLWMSPQGTAVMQTTRDILIIINM